MSTYFIYLIGFAFTQGLGLTGPALRWTSGTAEKSQNYMIPIAHITEVYVGKCTRVLRSKVAAASVSANCLTIISRKVSLNLDCSSASQVISSHLPK